MDTLTDEAKRLIRNKGTLERLHNLIHPKKDEGQEPEPTVEVDSEDGEKVTLRRLGIR